MESLLSELATGVQLNNVMNYISGAYRLSSSISAILIIKISSLVAMLSWVVWDHGLTFTEDVRFVRQLKHGSLGAFLFLANRYGAEIGMASIIYSKLASST